MRLVEAKLARGACSLTVASTDSAIIASIGSPGREVEQREHPGRDEQQHRDRSRPGGAGRDGHQAAAASPSYFSQTSLKRIIPSGIGS